MEVHITSKEMVKPSSQEVYARKPFSLSLIDQLTPANYSSLIFFYIKPDDSHFNSIAQIMARLKKTLPEALNQFYPLSGRTIDNLYIHSYDKGVPYVEARVKGCLADCVAETDQEWLSKLLPCQNYCVVPTSTSPQIALQVNIFDCGGIAISFCGSHKLMDASTTSAFFKSWAAFNRGSNGEITCPDMLNAGSRLFPPLESIPQKYSSFMESLWFQEGWHTTRRFMFDHNAIASLKLKAKSKRLESPTRSVALAAFLWKHAMLACREASGRSKPSILSQSMNLRPRIKPRLPEHAIGNLLCAAVSSYNSAERDIELHELAYLVREAMDTAGDQIPLFQSGDISNLITDLDNQIADVEFFEFTSWLNTLDGNEADFGWGQPSSVSLGRTETRYSSCSNAIILKSIDKGKLIEALITLDAKAMNILEHHSDFLAFASPASSSYPNKSKI